jgi:hypothetical protein
MPQVMETNVPVATRALNASGFQCLVEGLAQSVNRIPSPGFRCEVLEEAIPTAAKFSVVESG